MQKNVQYFYNKIYSLLCASLMQKGRSVRVSNIRVYVDAISIFKRALVLLKPPYQFTHFQVKQFLIG